MINTRSLKLSCLLHVSLLLILSSITSTFAASSTAFTSSVATTTDFVTGTGTGSTDATSTLDPSSTPYEFEVETNDVTWLIVGLVVGVVIVFLAVFGAAIAYAVYRNKRVHPHSDTESICSESEEYKTRPTTASHIYLDPDEDEAMSKPVAMTPFELRKLYIETFPYSKWKAGYDGSLRPHMGLKFVPPNLYSKTKGDERHFRDKIYNFEHSDSLTLRSSALSRMMRHSTLPAMREHHSMIDTVEETEVQVIGNGMAPTQHQSPRNFVNAHDDRPIQNDDVELI